MGGLFEGRSECELTYGTAVTQSSNPNEHPADANRLLAEARQHYVAGRADRAESILFDLLAQSPRQIQALLALGIIAAESGRPEAAAKHLREILALDPSYSPALCWMSFLELQNNQIESAREFAELAVSADPSSAASRAALARCLTRKGLLPEAIVHFQKAIDLDPRNSPHLYEYAEVLIAVQLWLQAGDVLKKAVTLHPDARSLQRLALAELRLGRVDDAERSCRLALTGGQDLQTTHLLMAQILTQQHKSKEADGFWRRASELEGETGRVNFERALSLSAIGHFDEAVKELRRSIELSPAQGDAYQALVSAKRIDSTDLPLVHQMEELLSRDSLPDIDRVNLFYSLGKSYDNMGDSERAIDYFDRANNLRKGSDGFRSFDRLAFKSSIDARIALFSRDLFSSWKHPQEQTSLPILIVGMMRSGTTLVEQMLSCHSKVGTAGEQHYWGEREASMIAAKSGEIDSSRMRACAREYVNLLSSIAPGFPHVVDKNPANLQVLGSIHLAFPNACIISTRRNAIDTALSIWMTPMKTSAGFICDRENIVFALKEYARLMDHWRDVLPSDRLLDIQYENVTSDPGYQARRMVEFCGLEWDEACLHPEQNKRIVSTPSLWQVRQPIYKSSTERWKNYEPWLGAFEDLRELR